MRLEHSGKLNASAERVMKGTRRAARQHFLLKTGSDYYWKACAGMAAFQSRTERKALRRASIALVERVHGSW